MNKIPALNDILQHINVNKIKIYITTTLITITYSTHVQFYTAKGY